MRTALDDRLEESVKSSIATFAHGWQSLRDEPVHIISMKEYAFTTKDAAAILKKTTAMYPCRPQEECVVQLCITANELVHYRRDGTVSPIAGLTHIGGHVIVMSQTADRWKENERTAALIAHEWGHHYGALDLPFAIASNYSSEELVTSRVDIGNAESIRASMERRTRGFASSYSSIIVASYQDTRAQFMKNKQVWDAVRPAFFLDPIPTNKEYTHAKDHALRVARRHRFQREVSAFFEKQESSFKNEAGRPADPHSFQQYIAADEAYTRGNRERALAHLHKARQYRLDATMETLIDNAINSIVRENQYNTAKLDER